MTDTSIRISKETKRRLSEYGEFGDSWDDLLNRLADLYDEALENEGEDE